MYKASSKVLLLFTLMIVLLCSVESPLLAQSSPSLVSPPAEKYAVTAGGVDMRTGQYSYNPVDLSLGASGEEGISLSRSLESGIPGQIMPIGVFNHNWQIGLTEKRISLLNNKFRDGDGYDYQINIYFGGRSNVFRAFQSVGAYELVSRGSGGRLTFSGNRDSNSVIYTYTAGDGTKIVFRPLGDKSTSYRECGSYLRCAYAASVTSADGTSFDLNYEAISPSAAGGDNPHNTARLRSVVSNRGYGLVFNYTSPNSIFVSRVCAFNLAFNRIATGACPADALTVSYSYPQRSDGTPPLGDTISVTGVDGTISSYQFQIDSTGFAMAFIKPGQTVPWLVNYIGYAIDAPTPEEATPKIVVGYQRFADGRTFSYQYDYGPADGSGRDPGIAGGKVTDNLGRVTKLQYAFPILPRSRTSCRINCPPGNVNDDGTYFTFAFQLTPDPVEITDPLGRKTVQDFCDPNAAANLPPDEIDRCLVAPTVQSITDPEGGKTYYTWDYGVRQPTKIRHVPKPGAPLAPGDPTEIVMQAEYLCSASPCFTKPTKVIDARGNATDIEYSTVHGGILTESLPADASGVRLVRRYSYVQRYAWVLGSGGGYVQGAAPVWLLDNVRYCRTSATSGGGCAGGAADEVVTSYDYGPDSGPNNLWLRGQVVTAGGVSLRTCYGYDAQGNRISETKPRAGLAVCP